MATQTPTEPSKGRDRAKAERYDALLQEAARLFAARGFDGVSLEDLGAAVGITGPAVYRHFSNKRALLGAVLRRASEAAHGWTSRHRRRRRAGSPAARAHRLPRRVRTERR
jgi:AcrR family transcriptional regulator